MTRTSLTKPAFAVLLALLAGPAMAQQQHQHGHAAEHVDVDRQQPGERRAGLAAENRDRESRDERRGEAGCGDQHGVSRARGEQQADLQEAHRYGSRALSRSTCR